MKTISGINELEIFIGQHVGYSDWFEVTQQAVNQFAVVTHDEQWIHVDVERAKEGPFGHTIAHGYFALSLLPHLVAQIYRVANLEFGLNYGSNKVRYPSPIPVGSRIRAGVELLSLEKSAHGFILLEKVTVEIEGAAKPGCVAEIVSLLIP